MNNNGGAYIFNPKAVLIGVVFTPHFDYIVVIERLETGHLSAMGPVGHHPLFYLQRSRPICGKNGFDIRYFRGLDLRQTVTYLFQLLDTSINIGTQATRLIFIDWTAEKINLLSI